MGRRSEVGLNGSSTSRHAASCDIGGTLHDCLRDRCRQCSWIGIYVVEEVEMNKPLEPGDLVEFYSSFETFMSEYEEKNPGIYNEKRLSCD